MLYIILLAVLVLFFTYGSITGVKQTKRMLDSEQDEKARVQYYAVITFSMWVPVIALLLVTAFTDISLADVGFAPLSFDLNITVTGIVLAAALLWAAYCLYRIIAFLVSAKHRQRRNALLERKANGNDYYDLVDAKLMTPKTKHEKRWWLGVSLTTGICEEIIFRGFFIFLIANIFPDMSIYWAAAIAVALFGLGHLYQGGKGVVITVLAGAFLALLYIVSGSLMLVAALHFLTNFANAFEYSNI